MAGRLAGQLVDKSRRDSSRFESCHDAIAPVNSLDPRYHVRSTMYSVLRTTEEEAECKYTVCNFQPADFSLVYVHTP